MQSTLFIHFPYESFNAVYTFYPLPLRMFQSSLHQTLPLFLFQWYERLRKHQNVKSRCLDLTLLHRTWLHHAWLHHLYFSINQLFAGFSLVSVLILVGVLSQRSISLQLGVCLKWCKVNYTDDEDEHHQHLQVFSMSLGIWELYANHPALFLAAS